MLWQHAEPIVYQTLFTPAADAPPPLSSLTTIPQHLLLLLSCCTGMHSCRQSECILLLLLLCMLYAIMRQCISQQQEVHAQQSRLVAAGYTVTCSGTAVLIEANAANQHHRSRLLLALPTDL